MIASLEEATVDMLINVDSRQWNPDLVDGIFPPKEAALIIKITLVRCEAKDSLFWPLTQDSNYTKKLGYKFLKEEAEVRPLADSESQDTGLWKGIWAVKVQNQVKNHLWRACRNSLPTKTNLVRRTIIANDIWDRCHGAAETVAQALWECLEIDVVWNDAALWDFRFTSEFVDFKHLAAWIIAHQKNSKMFAMLAWAIWIQRNKVLASQSLKLHQAYIPGVIEAIAVHSGITLASDIGFHKAVVEGDSKVVMTVLQQGREILTPDGLLIEDIRLSSTLFTQLHCSHNNRESNKVAYSLAKYTLHVSKAVV
ncbi:hypothetical protein SO802_014244 [Lithocarpus litseifolius]|uniref:RNase H type-1 domain-containing protein n=1 Tax=Lithocarpus litseifolius TaxID=425828 RepID=A0AAW2CSF0_9ROSI